MKTNIPLIIFIILSLTSCKKQTTESNIIRSGKTIIDRIDTPQNYSWVIEESNSFGEFLQNLELEPDGQKIVDFQNNPIANQLEHVAVIKKDIGTKDLQQCADAVIRLRADYLWERKQHDKIEFHFTNGDLFRWKDYKNGIRPVLVTSNKVDYIKTAAFDDSYESFRKYLDIVFTYAGTISLNKETVKVKNNENIKTGDILITAGSPGHVVIVVGTAKNKSGKKIYLLAQGYTPAQSIHIITNPFETKLNPWYTLDISKNPTMTARYGFNATNIRSFKD